ncbi:GGDEF domain-containing protein [Pseudokineococcus sp. 5B2Z-1]|uniref:GGDEF domain-containing protein n=1 Tax=Pseudokineococcus sp. 5B2Z-1 TaxID=3132744 RepID=UPI0030B48506
MSTSAGARPRERVRLLPRPDRWGPEPGPRRLLVGAAGLGAVGALAGAAAVATSPSPSVVAACALAGVHLAALGVLVVRARGGSERATWRLVLAAGLLLGVASAPPVSVTTFPLMSELAVLGVSLGSLLLVAAQVHLVRVRLRAAGLYGLFDVVAGFLTSAALTWALLAGSVHATTGLSTWQSCLVLLPAVVSLLSCAFVVTSTTLSGGWADGRVRAVVAASTVLLVGTWGAAAAVAASVEEDAIRAGLATCAVLVTVLLALAAALPRPRSVQRRPEDQRAAVIGPVVLTVVCLAVLLAGQTRPVLLPAAVAAALAVVVVLGKVVVLLGTLTAYQRARREADTDDLTGLGNRRALRELLDRSTTEPTAAVLLDLDGFKAVNDDLGHDAGDDLLRLVAERLRASAGPGEHLVRLGGDEFALLLPGAGADDGAARARGAVAVLTPPFALARGEVVVGASAGVSASPDHGPGGDELLRRADAAMYVAKRGRGGVVVHPAEERSTAGRPT